MLTNLVRPTLQELFLQLVPRAASAGPARATITPTHLETTGSTTDGTSFVTGSVAIGTSELGIVGVISCIGGATGTTPTTVAGTGLSFTQFGTAFDFTVSPARRISLWRAMPGSAFSNTITLTFGATQTSVLWSVFKFAGVDTSGSNGSGAIVQVTTGASGVGTAIAANVLSAFEHSKNLCVAINGSSQTAPTITEGDGFTLIGTNTIGTTPARIHSQHRLNTTAATATLSSSIDWGSVAFEVKSAVA